MVVSKNSVITPWRLQWNPWDSICFWGMHHYGVQSPMRVSWARTPHKRSPESKALLIPNWCTHKKGNKFFVVSTFFHFSFSSQIREPMPAKNILDGDGTNGEMSFFRINICALWHISSLRMFSWMRHKFPNKEKKRSKGLSRLVALILLIFFKLRKIIYFKGFQIKKMCQCLSGWLSEWIMKWWNE